MQIHIKIQPLRAFKNPINIADEFGPLILIRYSSILLLVSKIVFLIDEIIPSVSILIILAGSDPTNHNTNDERYRIISFEITYAHI